MIIIKPEDIARLNKKLRGKITVAVEFDKENASFILKIPQVEPSESRSLKTQRALLFLYKYNYEIPCYFKYQLTFKNIITYEFKECFEYSTNRPLKEGAINEGILHEMNFCKEKNILKIATSGVPTHSDIMTHVLSISRIEGEFVRIINQEFYMWMVWPSMPLTFNYAYSILKPDIERIKKGFKTYLYWKEDKLLDSLL